MQQMQYINLRHAIPDQLRGAEGPCPARHRHQARDRGWQQGVRYREARNHQLPLLVSCPAAHHRGGVCAGCWCPVLLWAWRPGGHACSFPGIASFGAGHGYKGDLSPAAALNILTTDKKSILVDIRKTAEKEASGIPDLPGSASSREVELEFAFTE
eukprot:scaffold652268_cov47-Prasinocladus_malaysianus.AAC.1